ncbi:MAG TPA: pyridoxal-phosphate dependent enzyme [Polyangia bacterium]|jgi:threonine dehydratase
MTGAASGDVWPISLPEVLDAAHRLRPYLPPTPLRHYAPLDAAVGQNIRVLVKHEDCQPTNSFKARNNLSVMTALPVEERRRGVVAATRGNHGAGLAWAGRLLSSPVTICVPRGNNPEKNEAMRGLGAELIEEGDDYDAAVAVAHRLEHERGLRMVHSTNDPQVVAGAGTLTLEMLDPTGARSRAIDARWGEAHPAVPGEGGREGPPLIDALVIAVGGGSQAVGALVVARALRPGLPVYAVQAANASAIHDSFHAGRPLSKPSADTFADGLATRNTYPLTFGALSAGLAGFVAVSEAELAEAVRLYLRTTHHLAEGAGAAGLAGLMRLRDQLAGKRVGVVLSGSNIDAETLRRIVNHEL